jgi:hypothetical protein
MTTTSGDVVEGIFALPAQLYVTTSLALNKCLILKAQLSSGTDNALHHWIKTWT